MRFQRVKEGQLADVQASGKWRPPEYIDALDRGKDVSFNENYHIQPKSGSCIAGGGGSNGKKRNVRGHYWKHERQTQGVRSFCKLEKHHRDERRERRFTSRLPLPPTQLVRRSLRETRLRRLFAMCVALSVGFALLLSAVGALSDHLEKLASLVETRNELMKGPRRAAHVNRVVEAAEPFRFGRQLSNSAATPPTVAERTMSSKKHHGNFMRNAGTSINAISRITKALTQQPVGTLSASIVYNSAAILGSGMRKGETRFIVPATESNRTKRGIDTRSQELYRVYHVMGQNRGKGERQRQNYLVVPLPNQTSNPPFTQHLAVGDARGSATVDQIQSVGLTKRLGGLISSVTGPEIVHSQPLHNTRTNRYNQQLVNRVGAVGKTEVVRSAVASATGGEEAENYQHFAQLRGNQNPRYTKGTKHHGKPYVILEGVELWKLSEGKYLCRIFNTGRLSNGTLVLPKWLRAHSDVLRENCGVRSPLFVVENATDRQRFHIDHEALRASGTSSPVDVDRTNCDLDLFGGRVPRDHMPHFVSDIFMVLVASEKLLRPERKESPFLLLPYVPAASRSEFAIPSSEVNPCLYMQRQSWGRRATEWVPSLARLFQHPALGFKIIPAPARSGAEVSSKKTSDKRPQMTGFRSILTSNMNSHEPHGMFGEDGTNFVFRSNGISRDPPWTTEGMFERPCKAVVTVLTRQGPRALLGLGDLQRKVRVNGEQEGLRLETSVVDFNQLPFDKQVHIMQEANVLIATHGAGNSNFIFMRPTAAVIEVFPFSYKAGPFDSFAKIFDLQYVSVMSAPQTEVFKECMNRHEKNKRIKKLVFSQWDKAVLEEKASPWTHRLEFEKEFGEPGKSEGMTTRMCVRLQELEFDVDAVTRMVVNAAKSQCLAAKHWKRM